MGIRFAELSLLNISISAGDDKAFRMPLRSVRASFPALEAAIKACTVRDCGSARDFEVYGLPATGL